jgi:hypothetical protein
VLLLGARRWVLSKKLLMYGKFDEPTDAVFPANSEHVALMNRLMSRDSMRFIYSTDENFAWMKDDGSIGTRRDAFDKLKEFQASNGG